MKYAVLNNALKISINLIQGNIYIYISQIVDFGAKDLDRLRKVGILKNKSCPIKSYSENTAYRPEYGSNRTAL